MPKSSVIQLVLIIVGIIAAYTGVMHLLTNAVYTLVVAFQGAGGLTWQYTLVALLVTAGYFLCAYFLITHSKSWSQSLVSRSGLGDFSITAQPRQILFFLFVAISISTLVKEIPDVIYMAVNGFSDKLSGEPMGITRTLPVDWTATLLKLLIPVLLLIFAAPLASNLANKLDDEAITVEEATSEGI
jgi:hypothetical protein